MIQPKVDLCRSPLLKWPLFAVVLAENIGSVGCLWARFYAQTWQGLPKEYPCKLFPDLAGCRYYAS